MQTKLGGIASLLGITQRQVNKLVKDGVLPRAGRGLYDVGETIRAYIEHIRSGKLATKRDAVYEQDLRYKLQQTRKLELENARLSGKSLPIEEVARVWERITVAVKTNIMLLENEIPRVRAAASDAEAKSLFRKATLSALSELSSSDLDLPDSGAQTGGQTDTAAVAPATRTHHKPVGRRKHAAKPRRQQRARKVPRRPR